MISLGGSNEIVGAYLTDTLSPSQLLHFTASVRYNRNAETLDGYTVDSDVGDVGSGFDTNSPLTGNHSFSRLNPSLGFTVTPTDALTLYADYNQASRAPTVIELGCANPAAPCGLPNDFASDPDLKQVVARTIELGARGITNGNGLHWSVDVFHTVNRDDIQFVATSTNQGYFDNVGSTRRQGADLSLGGKPAKWSWRLVYSFVDATFQSNFEVNGDSNSSADQNGNIQVRPGDRIPLIARHTGRLVRDYAMNAHWDVGANVIASSGVFLHGDENNANQAGGTNGEGSFIAGSGWISGYTVLNMNSTYHIGKAVEVFVRVVNLFDKHYATAGFLTSNAFDPDGSFRADPNAVDQRERGISGAAARRLGGSALALVTSADERSGRHGGEAGLRRRAAASLSPACRHRQLRRRVQRRLWARHHRHLPEPRPGAVGLDAGVAGAVGRSLAVRPVCRRAAHRSGGGSLRSAADLCLQHGDFGRAVLAAGAG